ncbi:MAG: hypothetical protein U0353_13660 [Sandaracinus sp.]
MPSGGRRPRAGRPARVGRAAAERDRYLAALEGFLVARQSADGTVELVVERDHLGKPSKTRTLTRKEYVALDMFHRDVVAALSTVTVPVGRHVKEACDRLLWHLFSQEKTMESLVDLTSRSANPLDPEAESVQMMAAGLSVSPRALAAAVALIKRRLEVLRKTSPPALSARDVPEFCRAPHRHCRHCRLVVECRAQATRLDRGSESPTGCQHQPEEGWCLCAGHRHCSVCGVGAVAGDRRIVHIGWTDLVTGTRQADVYCTEHRAKAPDPTAARSAAIAATGKAAPSGAALRLRRALRSDTEAQQDGSIHAEMEEYRDHEKLK